MRWLRMSTLIGTVCVASCHDIDRLASPVSEAPALGIIAADTVPLRTFQLSDTEVWNRIATTDGYAIIGLKTAGGRRGIWKSEVLVSRSDVRSALELLTRTYHVQVLSIDTLLPVARVRIPDAHTFQLLKALPMVDYIDPSILQASGPTEAEINGPYASAFSDDGSPSVSCGFGSLRGGGQVVLQGDRVGPNFQWHQIPASWVRANGAGVVVGLVDTGISATQGELLTGFATGLSYQTNRWIQRDYVFGGSWHDECGHGTRMAGVIAAPANGANTVGVAWGANLVAIRHANGVVDVDAWNVANGIRKAVSYDLANYPRRVVAMAFEAQVLPQYVHDEIRYWYYHDTAEVLFVAASGTSPDITNWIWGVIFPASMDEVIAVSLVDYVTGAQEPYHSIDGIHYGPDVELASACCPYATGQHLSDVVSLSGSSSATAIVAGIAALAWEQYPHYSNVELRSHLNQSGHFYPNRNEKYGFGVIDALKAVGGLYDAMISVELLDDRGYIQEFRLTAQARGGDGPYLYQWDHGPSTSSVVVTKHWDESFEYRVVITDSHDGITQSASGLLAPNGGGGGECDPTQPIC